MHTINSFLASLPNCNKFGMPHTRCPTKIEGRDRRMGGNLFRWFKCVLVEDVLETKIFTFWSHTRTEKTNKSKKFDSLKKKSLKTKGKKKRYLSSRSYSPHNHLTYEKSGGEGVTEWNGTHTIEAETTLSTGVILYDGQFFFRNKILVKVFFSVRWRHLRPCVRFGNRRRAWLPKIIFFFFFFFLSDSFLGLFLKMF